MEYDDESDTRPTHSMTAGAKPNARNQNQRPGDGSRPSTAEAATAGLVLLVAVAAVLSVVPAAAGVSIASSDSPLEVSNDAAVPATIHAPQPSESTDSTSISGGFSRSTYTAIAGDPVEIRHASNNPDGSAYLLIGGNRLSDTGQSVGYLDVVKITGDNTVINTRTIGTNQTNVQSCARDDVSCDLTFRDEDGSITADSLENLTTFAGATAADGLARPLAPQRYRLAITNGTFIIDGSGIVQPTEVAEQADLVLKKPMLHDEIEVFTSIDPSALEDGSEPESVKSLRNNGLDRTAVTKGNRIVLGFEATGIWGALSHFAAKRDAGPIEAGKPVNHTVLTDFLAAEEGVSLRVRQTNPGQNQPRSTLDLSQADSEDVMFLPAKASKLQSPSAPGRFYLVIDTSDGDHFTEPPEPGDKFTVEFALEGVAGQRYFYADDMEPPSAFNPAADKGEAQFPYWDISDSGARAEASFSVRERYVRYNDVTDEGEIIVESDTGRITGTTSLLPVRELSATFVNDAGEAPFRTESQLKISDGNFTIDVGLDDEAPGTRLNYELYDGTTLYDSRTIIVVGDATNPDKLVIDDAPENITVTRGGNLSAIQVDVRNTGGLTGEDDLTLTVGDSTVTGSWGVRLGPNESRSFDFGATTANLKPGTYPFALRIDGDTHNGTLIVESDPATTTIRDNEPAAVTSNTTDSDMGKGDRNANETKPDNASDPTNPNETNSSSAPSNDQPDDRGSNRPGLIPFPFGTREALGGTALVGAIHLLGHWV